MNENLSADEVSKHHASMALEDAIFSAFSFFGLQCDAVRIPSEAGGGIFLSSREMSYFGSHLARGLNSRGFTSARFESTPMVGIFIGKEHMGNPVTLREALAQELALLRPVMDDVEFLQRI